MSEAPPAPLTPELSAVGDLLALMRLIADPADVQSRLSQLAEATAKADNATAEVQVEQQNLDAKVAQLAARAAALDAQEADLRRREAEVKIAAIRNASDLQAIEAFRQKQRNLRLVQHGGGLTSEPDDTPDAPDPIFDQAAEPMTLAPVPLLTGRRGPRGAEA